MGGDAWRVNVVRLQGRSCEIGDQKVNKAGTYYRGPEDSVSSTSINGE